MIFTPWYLRFAYICCFLLIENFSIFFVSLMKRTKNISSLIFFNTCIMSFISYFLINNGINKEPEIDSLFFLLLIFLSIFLFIFLKITMHKNDELFIEDIKIKKLIIIIINFLIIFFLLFFLA